jgi:isoleucyl-tRNA synthetase
VLRRYEAFLPTIFIVSEVSVEPGDASDTAGQTGAPVDVEVRRSTGTKCERCWRYVPEVSQEPGQEGLCDRCLAALAERVES